MRFEDKAHNTILNDPENRLMFILRQIRVLRRTDRLGIKILT